MLFLSEKQVDELVEHSKSEYPNEVCGILAGPTTGQTSKTYPEPFDGVYPERSRRAQDKLHQMDRKVEKIYRMSNTNKSRTTFFMDPKEQLKVMKEIRNLELEMVGIYHSHPETDAYPSAHDVELAYYPGVSYIIVSIKDKDKPEIKSFSIVDGKIEREEIKIVEG